MQILKKSLFILLTGGILSGCSQTDQNDQPLSYDPPGSTNTKDKQISPQTREVVGFENAGVWFSNDFEGGRANAVRQIDADKYEIDILPENAPVNNSAWYAFQVWSREARRVQVTLNYSDGNHRYQPKIRTNDTGWKRLAEESWHIDSARTQATLSLDVSPDTLLVSGQELITSSVFEAWTDSLVALPYVHKSVIAESREGRPLSKLTISNVPNARRFVLVISRQHPPEVSGSFALMAFIERLCSDTDLAQRFRDQFIVVAVPLMNPDGVDNGHWRHNRAGVDLNRDWLNFNQPETRAVSQMFLGLKDNPENKVYFGIDFHSTQEDVFYTVTKDFETFPDRFSDRWLARLGEKLPDYHINEDPSGVESPTSKSWFYRTFNVDAVTYEVGDEVERPRIRMIATNAADAMMEVLLNEVE